MAFIQEYTVRKSNWMIQMKGVRVVGPFSGIHSKKIKISDKDKECTKIQAFFSDTLSENQN
jgi:hypothetical protein